MTMRLHGSTALTVTTFAALALFIAACGAAGYGDASEPTGARPTATNAARTPAATAPAAPQLTPAAVASPATVVAAAATPTSTAAPARAATQLTLVASSVRFDTSSLTAPAGPVTIAFDNRDEGVPHNLHVFVGSDASGAEVGSTEIQAGAVQQDLALGDLAAGTYFYQCDVHPSQMRGTLTVS